jgi:hypothetical protein
MTSGLEQSDTILALFSPVYFQAKFALAELQAAFADDPLNERESILPILLKEVDIPKPFNILSYVDVRTLGENDMANALRAVLGRRDQANRHPAESRIPDANTPAVAQKLLDDLELAYTIFRSQCAVCDRLVDAIRERDPKLQLDTYETFIANHYGAMTPDERTLHQRIRDQTDTIKKFNRHALYCIEASKNF